MTVEIRDRDACWPWTGGTNTNGYGQVHIPGCERVVLAHRAMYRLVRGSIPKNLEIDHLCKNRSCCNPWHMELVTRTENVRRSPVPPENRGKNRTGYPYSPLWRRRKELKLSRRALAEKSGVGKWAILAMEQGRADPHLSTVRKLAEALDLDPSDLFSPTPPVAESAS